MAAELKQVKEAETKAKNMEREICKLQKTLADGNCQPEVSSSAATKFVHYNFSKADLYRDGMETLDDGLLHLTNNTNKSTGHALQLTSQEFVFCNVSVARRRPGTSFCGVSFDEPQV
ncbi:unnamed protein product [Eruca vesicaria subsp. sativa]|uniref:Uncharacterized protein n=1 Tax=Eruca vesicaria subsp. sativa TaxID=29727 RepID=A0ABC8KVZ5_ERUVS|nr:unnamed protein product [Eruca vesicaria subsp. sativa]